MIILASGSPRRKELLERNNVSFCIIKSEIEEVVNPNLLPVDVVKDLSRQKAIDVYEKNKDDFVIGADTIVVVNNEILGKPKDFNDEVRMLHLLEGNHHEVMTSVTFASKKEIKTIVSISKVYFKSMTDSEIIEYAKTEEPYDKAGGYAIQGLASKYISHIEGDFNTIVGFPIDMVLEELKANKLIL